MAAEHTTPAERIAARARRVRAVGIAGAVALLAAFSGLAAGRVAGSHDAAPQATAPAAGTAAPATSAQPSAPADDDFFGPSSGGTVSPAPPSAMPDAGSGAS